MRLLGLLPGSAGPWSCAIGGFLAVASSLASLAFSLLTSALDPHAVLVTPLAAYCGRCTPRTEWLRRSADGRRAELGSSYLAGLVGTSGTSRV